MPLKILILGGTTEAGLLARRLADRADIEAVLSLAGRTRSPAPQALPTRIGGFGGVEGLAAYLVREGIDLLVDATHPFAARMSFSAAEAALRTKVPLVAYSRAPWMQRQGDRWLEVSDVAAAAAALATKPRRRVLLTIGRLGIAHFKAAPDHDYIMRAIDPPPDEDMPTNHRLILDRGPFDIAAEIALLQHEWIDLIVTKNAGGASTYPKIEAARVLGIEVVMVHRPVRPDVPLLDDLEAVMAWIEAHGAASRGSGTGRL